MSTQEENPKQQLVRDCEQCESCTFTVLLELRFVVLLYAMPPSDSYISGAEEVSGSFRKSSMDDVVCTFHDLLPLLVI